MVIVRRLTLCGSEETEPGLRPALTYLMA